MPTWDIKAFFTRINPWSMKNQNLQSYSTDACWHVFMACSKLEAVAIYLVKQACGNDILASVYIDPLTGTFIRYHQIKLNLHITDVIWEGLLFFG